MVVQCKQCSTRFQLDVAKIPDVGIRVRCSRCKHAFFLRHPSSSAATAIEAVAEEALEHESLAAPGSTQDLPIASNPDLEPTTTEPDAAGAGSDEEDWEFNEDLPDDDPDDDLSDELAGELAGALEDELGNELESDVEAGAFRADSGETGSIDLDHEGSFSQCAEAVTSGSSAAEMSARDLTVSSMSIDTASHRDHGEPEPPPPAPGFGTEREDAFGSPEDLSPLPPPDEPAPRVSAVSQSAEAGEDPENWDFFADEKVARPAKPPTRSRLAQHLSAGGIAASRARGRPARADPRSDWQGLESDRPAGAAVRIASALAWVALFGLLSSGVYLGVADSLEPGVSAPAFVGIGPMRAANVRGQWLETVHAGTLFVVTGDLINPGIEAAAPGRAVAVSLLAEDGRELDRPPVFAGGEIGFDALRQMSLAGLRDGEPAAARALASAEIGPGQSTRFAAAFVALPERASHFQLQAADPDSIATRAE